MKSFLIFSLVLISSIANAETFTSEVHDVENGMVKFTNGRVAFLDRESVELFPQDILKVDVNESSSLLNFEKVGTAPLAQKSFSFLPEDPTTPPPAFEPTVVSSMAEAQNIFNRSNPYYKRISECSDRAHVWAHDEFKFSGTKSKKVFVFFTASYINSVRFKWWFHVAPLYTVNDNGTMKELVMDFRYTDRPMTVKEWTDKFVYTKRECKVTTKFSEYDVNPQTENCYLIYESMHYKIPGEISYQETQNRYKTTTSESELNASFNFAFTKKITE